MDKKTLVFIFIVVTLLLVGLVVIRGIKKQNALKENMQIGETREQTYQVRLKRGCKPSLNKNFFILLTTLRFQVVAAKLTESEKAGLKKDPCVLKVSTAAEARENFEKLPPEVQEAVKEQIKKQFLAKSILKRDIIDREKLLEILKEERPELPKEIISHYQLYVTPESLAVSQLGSGKTIYQLYEESVSWVWVSDPTLNSTEEKWLEPEEFLANTPTYSTNPVPGKIVSDCSEQANALASLLRAGGVSAENVRVVLGDVDFEGVVGGHAWVQVFEDGVWVDLDPTSGPYWDDEKNQLVQSSGLSFDYFKFFPFPVLETWAYYNDLYFYDLEIKEGNAPAIWR